MCPESHLAIMVLDVNFINPYKTAGFPFFNDKKADNSVVKRSAASSTSMWTSTFNNLRPLPKQPPHHIIIVSQCLMISWEKLFIDKIIRPKSNESMWYFRPLELLEGFFSSVFKLVVLEFIG